MGDDSGVTWMLRHGRTSYSAIQLCNGDPRLPVYLDARGRRASIAVASDRRLSSVVTCITSRFPRTKETADLLLSAVAHPVVRVVAPELDEIDYGMYEGGPWPVYGRWLGEHGRYAVPPGARECLDQAVRRQLAGLRRCLDYPGPRLVVGHGLMLSVLLCLAEEPAAVVRAQLPEAPYLRPMRLDDHRLRTQVTVGLDHLDRNAP